jgi:tetratricopeptide (TPR) repeat protein
MSKFKVWAAMYPDAFRAQYGYSLAALEENEYRKALDFLTPALSPKNPHQASAYFLQGAILLPLNRYAESRAAFQRAEALGVGGEKLEYAEVYAAERDFDGVRHALGAQSSSGMAGRDVRLRSDDAVFLIDQGRWNEALVTLAEFQKQAEKTSPLLARALVGTRLALDSYSGRATPAQWRGYIDSETRRLTSKNPEDHINGVFPMLSAAWVAAHHGDLASARKALAVAEPLVSADNSATDLGIRAIVQAEIALAENRPDAAVSLLRARHDGSELYFSHAELMRAYAARKDFNSALTEARWLAASRGLAYGEWNRWDMWSAPNVLESNLALLSGAEFALKLGQDGLARQQLQAFMRVWPQADQLPFVAPRLRVLRQGLETAGPRAAAARG